MRESAPPNKTPPGAAQGAAQGAARGAARGTPQAAEVRPRCEWPGTDPLYVAYHDEEWGVPVRDEGKMFEFLVLETFQAGLSWITILRRREAFRAAFAGFDAQAVARFDDADRSRLLADAGIIRNRAKIDAAIANAQATLALRSDPSAPRDPATGLTGLVGLFWSHAPAGGRPIVNHPRTVADLPAKTPLAEAVSADLKRRGFKFVGPTTIYAHMQASGLVNDHVVTCFRHGELAGAGNGPAAPRRGGSWR